MQSARLLAHEPNRGVYVAYLRARARDLEDPLTSQWPGVSCVQKYPTVYIVHTRTRWRTRI